MHRRKYGEESQSLHAISRLAPFSKPPRVHQPKSSLNPVLLLWRLHYVGMIEFNCLWQWFNQSPAPPFLAQRPGVETKSSNLQSKGWLSRQPAPALQRLPKVPSLIEQRQLYHCHSLRNSKSSRISVPVKGTKAKYIYFIINHSITGR